MTFYTVNYNVIGSGRIETAYFDNKNDAYDFYNAGDYRDKPQAHRISNPEKIKEYNELVCRTNWEIAQ